jgi:hypothetical protein
MRAHRSQGCAWHDELGYGRNWPSILCPAIHSVRIETNRAEWQKGDLRGISPFSRFATLERLDVFRLPALGALGHVELHRLALLKALETSRLDRREMHKNVFATLTADEAVAFGVVEPLHRSLFCHVYTSVPFNRFTLERFEGTEGQIAGLLGENCSRPILSNVACNRTLPAHLLQPRVYVRYAMVMTSFALMFREI